MFASLIPLGHNGLALGATYRVLSPEPNEAYHAHTRHRRGRVHRLSPLRAAGRDGTQGYRDRLPDAVLSRALKELNVRQLAAVGIPVLPLDLATDDLREAVRCAEVIYHGAAQPGISTTTSFDIYLRNNIVATERLLEAVAQSDTLRAFVYLGTSSVYGADATGPETSEPRPTSYYGVTKLA
ncbi:MAG: NAD-dependent epimerase/dehydratase family protein, partial [Chloroflexi bacterium]|nr:NAD-dependent epimerase/dehydratase family protein [Chloroflexota bacterium]